MKKTFLALIILISATALFSQGGAPLNFAVRLNVTNVTGSDPYTLTGTVQDGLGRWNASNINAAQDSIYHLEGTDLYIYRITSITSTSGNNFTIVVDDIMNTGMLPSTGSEWAAIKFTTNNQYPIEVGNLASTLKSCIDNRFKQRLDAATIPANIDYVTTDSFLTFTNGATFSSIPVGKTVWRTTTGSSFEKTSPTTMTRRSQDDGENAMLGFTQSGSTLLFNANLYNRVRLNTGNISSATVQKPSNYLAQAIGENFLIGITSGNTPLTVAWDTIYGSFNGTTFTSMPNTTIGQNSTIYFKFRTINPASEQVRFQYVDGGGSGGTNLASLPTGTRLIGAEKLVSPDSLTTWDKVVSQVRDSMAFIDVREYNIYPDGTDQTAKFNNMLTALNTAGRASKIILPAGTYRFNGLIRFPTVGSPIGSSIPFVIEGAGAYKRGSASYAPISGTIFDLRHSSTSDSARIIMNAATSVTWRDIMFLSTNSTADIPSLMTTHSVLTVDNCSFEGNGADDKAIKLGAFTSSFSPSGTETSSFQGYGSVIQNCWFNKLGRGVELGTFANDVDIVNNVWWNQCSGDCAIYVNDISTGQNDVGANISGNLFEMGAYQYAMIFESASQCNIAYNSYYDHGVGVVANVWFRTNAVYMNEIPGFTGAGSILNVKNDATNGGSNSYWDNTNNRYINYRQNDFRGNSYNTSVNAQSDINWNTANNHRYFTLANSANGIQWYYHDNTTQFDLFKVNKTTSTRTDMQLLGSADNRILGSAALRLHQAAGTELWLGNSNKYYELSGIMNATGDGSGSIAYAIGAGGKIAWSQTNASPGAAKDIAISRAAAGVLLVENGSNTTANIRANQYQFTATRFISSGPDSPEGVVTADVGSLYLRTNGTNISTLLYSKGGANGTNTGWTSGSTGVWIGTATSDLNMAGYNIANGNLATFDTVTVTTSAYGPSWNGSNVVPSMDAIYDKIESLPTTTTKVTKGGDADAAALRIGTNDAQSLELETNNTLRLRVNSSGTFDFQQSAFDNIDMATMDSVAALALRMEYAPNVKQRTLSATGSLFRDGITYINSSIATTMTVNAALPDLSLFKVRNINTGTVTIAVPGGWTLNGSAIILPGETGEFHRNGTVIYRLDNGGKEYEEIITATTGTDGVFVLNHPFGASAIKFAAATAQSETEFLHVQIKTLSSGVVSFQIRDAAGAEKQVTNVPMRCIVKI